MTSPYLNKAIKLEVNNDIIDLKPVKPVTPPKNSTWLYPNEIPPHLIHEIKAIDYDVMGVNLLQVNAIPLWRKKRLLGLEWYYRNVCVSVRGEYI